MLRITSTLSTVVVLTPDCTSSLWESTASGREAACNSPHPSVVAVIPKGIVDPRGEHHACGASGRNCPVAMGQWPSDGEAGTRAVLAERQFRIPNGESRVILTEGCTVGTSKAQQHRR